MSDIVIIQSSLSPNSKTALVAKEFSNRLSVKYPDHDYLDLRDIKMEFCDGRKIHGYNPEIQKVYKTLSSANCYVIAFPVYSYSFPGVLKNFIDILSGAMLNKHTAIIANAGSPMSFLAPAELIKLLTYDFNITTIQPTIFTTDRDFENNTINNPKVFEKMDQIIRKILENIVKS